MHVARLHESQHYLTPKEGQPELLRFVRMTQSRAKSVRITSIAHATEDAQKVVQAVLSICPEDFPRGIQTERVKGHYGNEIIICHLRAVGRSASERFFENLWRKMSSQDKSRIYDQAQEHVDGSGTLHLRIDKQEASKGKIRLQDNESVKVEIMFKTLDKSEESRVEMVKRRMEALS